MTPGLVQERIISSRVTWIREMLDGIRSLPLGEYDRFCEDRRNVAAADSYLRRALEALLDLGRHIAARGFGRPASEYKEVALTLGELGVLTPDLAELLKTLAGYRNRLVHFYDRISERELYEICRAELEDIEAILNGVLEWINANRDRVDPKL